MNEYINILRGVFEQYGLWFIFPLVLMENFPFIGFLTPAVTTLLLAGFLLVNDINSLINVIIVAYLAMIIGDNLWFILGNISKGRWKWLQKVTKKSPNAIHVINKQSIYILLFYQFAPYFRMFLPYAFGVTKFPTKKWIFINLVGSILYVCTFVFIGYFSAISLKNFGGAELLSKKLNIVLIALSAIYAIYLIFKFYRKKIRDEE